MNEAPADPRPLSPTPPSDAGWPWRKLAWLAVFLFAAHVGALFVFGGKKPATARAVINLVPHLQLTSAGDELIALGDPTLFVLPHPDDFGAPLWQHPADRIRPVFHYTEDPEFLKLNPETLGAAFQEFVQTNRFAPYAPDFKPALQLAAPALTDEPAGTASTWRITGELARRPLLDTPALPALAYNDILPPSKVQVSVNAEGFVASLVPLPPENAVEAKQRAEVGETNALRIARKLRFAPAAQATFGEIIFNWHTVPLLTTNTP